MVIINGQQFTDEQFAAMQEEQARKIEEQYNQFCSLVKCGYAIIPEMNIVICGLDGKQINPFITCKGCVSYNEKIFEIIE